MDPKDVKLIDEARAKFDAISDKARETIYRKVLEHYQKHPGSPWSGAPLRDLELMIRQFYSDMGLKYDKVFRETLPPIMQKYYDRAVEEMKSAGVRNAILGKPDTARVKYFLDSAFEQVAMKTQNMSFQHIRALRTITADVTRQMSITGATRRQVSKELLNRAMEIPGFEFIDKSGTKWQLKSYFNTLARTELMNAARASYDDKCSEEGFDVMKLTTSGKSCDHCSKYEGKLFSLTGTTKNLPTKQDLMDDGVFHPNCTHSYSLVPKYIAEKYYGTKFRTKEDVLKEAEERKRKEQHEKHLKHRQEQLERAKANRLARLQAIDPSKLPVKEALEKVDLDILEDLENAKNKYKLQLDKVKAEYKKALQRQLDAQEKFKNNPYSKEAKQTRDYASRELEKVGLKLLKLKESESEFVYKQLALPKNNRAQIMVSSLDKKTEVIARKASELVGRMTDKTVIPPDVIGIPVIKGGPGRSYHKGGFVVLSLDSEVGTGIHEICHFIEFKNPHIHARCVEFLEYRCKGESSAKLRDLTGDLLFEPDETARPDNFFDPYCGKDYINSKGDRAATEILSMGLERMYKDPIGFYKTDPEYFSFVYNLLRGKI